jgi:hypothetical protein
MLIIATSETQLNNVDVGCLYRELNPEESGITGHLRNKLRRLMSDGDDCLNRGYIISFTEVCFMGEGNSDELTSVVYHINLV